MTYAKPEAGKKQPKVTSAENKRIVGEYSYFSSLPLSSNFLFFLLFFISKYFSATRKVSHGHAGIFQKHARDMEE